MHPSERSDPEAVGIEWLIDAAGCDATRLADAAALEALLDEIVADLGLRVLGRLVYPFPPPGGVTAMYLLAESHLCCHTWPERGVATFNLACCRPRPAWPWRERLTSALGARRVDVRVAVRGGGDPDVGGDGDGSHGSDGSVTP